MRTAHSYTRAATVDWQQLFLNLRAADLPTKVISRKVGLDPATIRRFQRGENLEPKWSQGLRALDLHLQLCAEKHEGLIR
jgi:hypothetical protein